VFPRRALLVPVFVLILVFDSPALAGTISVKIIAFNDFHGNLQSPGKFRVNADSPELPSGGIDFLSAYVSSLAAQNPNHVVVSAGDLIGASPLVSALFHDEPTIEAMNRLGLDLNAVGNHEFDKGRAELQRMQSGGCSTKDQNTCKGGQVGTPAPFEGARFQFLAANVLDAATGRPIFPAYAIKSFSGVRIAFIGLTLRATPTMVTPTGVAGLRFTDEAETINTLARDLRGQGIESVVILIHQGGEQTGAPPPDINACSGGLEGSPIQSIVSRLDDAVDLVVSGHTHQAYICRVANSVGRRIPVTSASSYGRLVTDIDLTIDADTKRIAAITARNILVDRTNPKIMPDALIEKLLSRYDALAAPLKSHVIGRVTADVTFTLSPGGEAPIGDLIADAQLEATRDSGHAVVAFMNRGGIRGPRAFYAAGAPSHPGTITYDDIFTVQPFGNSLVTMTLTGTQLHTLLEQQFKGCTLDFPAGNTTGHTFDQILQISSGFTYSWNPAGPVCAKVDPASIKINGVAITPEGKYRVTANSFLADGGDQLYEFTRGTDRVGGPQDIDALAAYFAAHPAVAPSPSARIRLTPQTNP